MTRPTPLDYNFRPSSAASLNDWLEEESLRLQESEASVHWKRKKTKRASVLRRPRGTDSKMAIHMLADEISSVQRLRHQTHRCMNHVLIDTIVGFYSSIYLLIIATDMMLDDILNKAGQEKKDAVIVRIDLAFLSLFLAEIGLRIFGQGIKYLRKGRNVVDLVVVLLGMIIDLLVVCAGFSDTSLFTFIRLGRALRVARIAAVLSRLYARRQQVKAKRNLTQVVSPPKCNWKGAHPRGYGGPKKQKRFAAFLSHTKGESATDARYLHDLLQLLLQTDVYLDSANLTDLRALFEEGVSQSEVLVLIASPSVLHSPWCLLEIWKAGQENIPVVVVAKPGFSAAGAKRFLRNLETELDLVNPGALDEVLRQAKEMRREPTNACRVLPTTGRGGCYTFPMQHLGGGGGGGGDGGGGGGGGGGLCGASATSARSERSFNEPTAASIPEASGDSVSASVSERHSVATGSAPASSAVAALSKHWAGAAKCANLAVAAATAAIGAGSGEGGGHVGGGGGGGSSGSLLGSSLKRVVGEASAADAAARKERVPLLVETSELDRDEEVERFKREVAEALGLHEDLFAEESCVGGAGAGADAAGETGEEGEAGEEGAPGALGAAGAAVGGEASSSSPAAVGAKPSSTSVLQDRMVRWAPHASDEQILASMVDLVELMGRVTGRTQLKWERSDAQEVAKQQRHHQFSSPRAACCACLKMLCSPRRLLRALCDCCAGGGGGGAAGAGGGGLCSVLRRRRDHQYKLFICYAPREATGVARFLQLALQRALRGPVVEEAGAEVEGVHTRDDLDELLHAIERSEAVMLVQTASVLYRPWTLLQVYTALCLEKPLICVHVEQGGYDHFAAKQLLANLREQLDLASPGAYAATRKLLHERSLSFDRMQQALLACIPAVISISYAPGGSANHADAVVQDIASRLNHHRANTASAEAAAAAETSAAGPDLSVAAWVGKIVSLWSTSTADSLGSSSSPPGSAAKASDAAEPSDASVSRWGAASVSVMGKVARKVQLSTSSAQTARCDDNSTQGSSDDVTTSTAV